MNNGQPKQGLEEPKFVPFKAKSLTLIALFPDQNLQQNIIFCRKPCSPWCVLAPHDALNTMIL